MEKMIQFKKRLSALLKEHYRLMLAENIKRGIAYSKLQREKGIKTF